MFAQDTAPAPPAQGMAGQQSNPNAQPMGRMRHHHPPSPEHQLRHLTKMLNLTSDQQTQMLPILQDQHKRMESLRNDQNLDPQQRRAQMRDAMMETHQKLEALMTATQKQQFEQMMQQRREHMHQGGMGQGNGAGAPPPPPQ
jgi:Spy/CpxP family protein refolding chaperone